MCESQPTLGVAAFEVAFVVRRLNILSYLHIFQDTVGVEELAQSMKRLLCMSLAPWHPHKKPCQVHGYSARAGRQGDIWGSLIG